MSSVGGWVGGYKYESGWAERQGARVMPSWQQRTGHTASEAYGWLRRRGPGQSRAGASLAHRGHMRVFPISSDVAATRSSGKGAVQFPAAAPPPFGPFTPPRATQGSPPESPKISPTLIRKNHLPTLPRQATPHSLQANLQLQAHRILPMSASCLYYLPFMSSRS